MPSQWNKCQEWCHARLLRHSARTSNLNTLQKWCIILFCVTSLSTIMIGSITVHPDYILGAGDIGGLAAGLIVVSCASLIVSLGMWISMDGDRQFVDVRFFWVFWVLWGGAAGWATGLWAAAHHLVERHPSGCDGSSITACADVYAAAAAQLGMPAWVGYILITFILLGGCCGARPTSALPTHSTPEIRESINSDSKVPFASVPPPPVAGYSVE